ncbi:MAG: RagB/SusD family nutrient uptake outer membrane protein [Bacteroides sp.]|nr:RagB/SusD family nutrient uptake outer membrane protein [Bacteroides sp.]
MKNIIILLSLLFFFSSCDSLLKTESDEELSGDEFWEDATSSDIESYIGSMYYYFRQATMQDAAFIVFSGDLRCAPIATTYSTTSKSYMYIDYLINNDLNGLRSTYSDDDYRGGAITQWKTFYMVIQEANILLEEISRPNLTENEVSQYEAEAIFIRSLAYFFLVRNFGDVPYYTNAYNQTSLSRTDMVTVLQALADDLQQTLDDDPDMIALPWTYTSLSKKAIRASRGAVYALLMHINMWLAGFDSTNASEYYQNVVACGEQLVDNNNGSYSLLDINQSSTIFAGGSDESIFEIVQNLSYGDTGEVFDSGCIYSNYVTYSCFSGRSAPYVYYTYDFMTDVYPVSEAGDKRVSLWFNENAYSTLATDYKEVLKFENVDTYDGTVTSNAGNQIVFRLADAYLLYAEALAELGTDDSKACELLNTIRSRAGASEVGVSGDDLKDYIYWERVRELIGEGHYFYDLVRTGKLCDSNYCYNAITRADYNEGAWTWPISSDALENNTNMTLNTYWE